MCESRLFQIVGHLDLIKVFKFLPTINLDKIYKNTLQAIKENNMAIEINSAGFRKKIKEQYPSEYILQMAKKFEIPITFGSDAHRIEDVGDVFLQGYNIAKKIGFKTAAVFENKEMKLIKI
jgi:histidinol-phosphatase (PHP family)